MFYMITHLQVPQNQIKNKPLWYFDTNNSEGVKKLFKEMKEKTNYQYDNTHLHWSNIFGHLFAISIHYSKIDHPVWNISLWDHTGGTAIANFIQEVENKETDVLSTEIYNKMSKVTEEYSQGKVSCSGCGKMILKDSPAGRYFAGVYCEDCWESKYKAIEAKETYN